MSTLEVRTQKQLDAAIKKAGPLDIIVLQGDGRFIFGGSSSPRVVARGSSSPTGTVGKYAAIVARQADKAKINIPGAVLLPDPGEIATAAEWCDYYGVPVADGLVTLYKALDDDYSTDQARSNGVFYRPGRGSGSARLGPGARVRRRAPLLAIADGGARIQPGREAVRRLPGAAGRDRGAPRRQLPSQGQGTACDRAGR